MTELLDQGAAAVAAAAQDAAERAGEWRRSGRKPHLAKSDFLSAAAARRIALAAQGFGMARPDGVSNLGHVRRAIDRLGLLQIDSVNVLARAHYLPLFSRLGNYDSDHLDRLAWGRKSQRGLFEFWAHEASLLPLAAHPLFRWRMQRARENQGNGKGKLHVFRLEKAEYIDEVLREIADRGPLAASELSNGGERRGAWWGWNDGKLAVEWLFFAGLVTTATRRGTFERVYDLTERVLPAHVQALPTPSAEEAQRELLRLSARALGVATEFDLRDYFRLGVADTKARLAELVESGRSAAGHGRRLEQARLSRPRRAPAAQGRGAGPAGAVRSADLGARSHAPHLRLLLSHRDLHAGGKTQARLLRAAFPAGRPAGGAGRSQGRSRQLEAARPRRPSRAGSRGASEVAGPLREELRLMADWLGLESVSLPRAGALAKAMGRMR